MDEVHGPSAPRADEGTSTRIGTNGVRLHAVRAGPEDGPLVVLLHGFPEFCFITSTETK